MAQNSSSFKTLSGLLSLLLVLGAVLPVGMLTNVPLADAATYTVVNLNDAGAGSLRQAITDANTNPGLDNIFFDNTLSGTINLASDLPSIFESSVILDGSTAQNGLGGADIVINASGRSYCLHYSGGSGHTLKGIACTGGTNGIVFTSSVNGGDIGGTGARELVEVNNATSAGVYVNGGDNLLFKNTQVGTSGANGDGYSIDNNSTNITIGGTNASDKNIIAGNTNYGIKVVNSAVNISGNWIGTSTGNNDAGNGKDGINMGTGAGGAIGGNVAGARNIISGNNEYGITLNSNSAITVSGNYIGLRSDGTAAIGNTLAGIRVLSSNNVIGGSSSSHRNIISGNGSHGIVIDASSSTANSNSIMANFIGTNANANATIPNGGNGIYITGGNVLNTLIGDTAQGNIISGNTLSGISIDNNGSTGTKIYTNTIGLLGDKMTAAGNGQYGIRTAGDSTQIGEGGVSTRVNHISSNGSYGVYLNGSDSSLVLNNGIGYAGDFTTPRANTGDAIYLDSSASSNTIGNSNAGAGNQIYAATGKVGVNISATAGNYNFVYRNSLVNASTGILRSGSSNESVPAPSINTGISNSSYLAGSAFPSALIEIYANGSNVARVQADVNGFWETHGNYSAASSYTASATNTTYSTSGTSTPVSISADVTAPTIPYVSSPSNGSAVNTTSVTLNGTKDANTSIWINGVQTVANDSLTTWSASGVALIEGTNVYTIVAKDYSSNSSATYNYSVIRDTVTPSTPTLDYPASATEIVTITGSGTESGATVYVNGESTGVVVDNLGNFIINYVLQAGNNVLSLTVVDNAGNTSGTAQANISNGASGGGSAAGGSSGGTKNDGPIVGNTDDDSDQESMAGEGEEDPVVPVEPEEDNDSNISEENSGTSNTNNESTSGSSTGSTNGSSTGSSTGSSNTGSQTGTKGSFYSGIYQYVQPIKVKTPRDDFPAKPVRQPKYSGKLLNGKFFENKNALGVPQILIDLKAKGEALTATRDSDGDGAYDWEELLYGGNPDVKDTDGDGTTDGKEIFITNTDPESYDTDKDGQADSIDADPSTYNAPEVDPIVLTDYIANEGIIDPLGVIDSDEDGLSDLTEFYKDTDPQDADSDADGLDDGEEVLFLGTDPNTTTTESALGGISIVNTRDGETVEAGEQLFMGHTEADSHVTAYEVESDGTLKLLGETDADENGSYVLLTSEALTAGEHTIVLASGPSLDDLRALSSTLTLNMVDYVKRPQYVGLGLQDGSLVNIHDTLLSLKAAGNYMIVVAWQSTIFSQTLIADAEGQIIEARPVENLELGDHKVTWYAQDLETGAKSTPTQISFEVTNTAFVTGETTSPWVIILGSIAVLASLSALALFYRNRRMKA